MPNIKSDVLGDSVKIDTFEASHADELSGMYFATCPIICAMATPFQTLQVIAAYLTSKACIMKSRLSTQLAAQVIAPAASAAADATAFNPIVLHENDQAESTATTATTAIATSTSTEVTAAASVSPEVPAAASGDVVTGSHEPVQNPHATTLRARHYVDWKYDKSFQYTAAHEVRMKKAWHESIVLKFAAAATPGLLQLLTPQQRDPLKHEHDIIVAGLNVATINVASAPVMLPSTDSLAPLTAAPKTSGTKGGTTSPCQPPDSDVGEGVDYDPVLEALFDDVADSIPICDDPSVLQELAAAAAEQRMQMAPTVVVNSPPPLAMPQETPPVSDPPTIANSITTGQFERTTSNYMTPTSTSSALRSGAVTPPGMFEGNNGGNSFGSPEAFRLRDKEESTPLIQISKPDVQVVVNGLIPPLREPLIYVQPTSDLIPPLAEPIIHVQPASVSQVVSADSDQPTSAPAISTTDVALASSSSDDPLPLAPTSQTTTTLPASKDTEPVREPVIREEVTSNIALISPPSSLKDIELASTSTDAPSPILPCSESTASPQDIVLSSTTSDAASPIVPTSATTATVVPISMVKPECAADCNATPALATVPNVPPVHKPLSTVSSEPFNIGDRVILTVPGNSDFCGVKATVLMTNLTTVKHKGTFIRVQVTDSGPKPVTVKTRVINVVHDDTEVPHVPKEHTTPSKRKRPAARPMGPPAKRAANDNDAALNTINQSSVCDHGSIPIAGPSASYSALLVPFIHAVANKISDITNEFPVGRGGRPAAQFAFEYVHFPIRVATNAQEFDDLVRLYATQFVAQNVTRASIYTDYCSSNGYIGEKMQERLTDPKVPLSYIEDLPYNVFLRLRRLANLH
jgi:hypothetical protein